MDRTLQRTCRVRLELPMVAAFKGQRNAIAERPQQVSGPRTQRNHDMARRDRAIREHHAPALAVRHDRLDIRLAELATGAHKHPRIGLHDVARRIDRRRLRVQQPNLVDRQDVRLERGNGLAVEQPALDAIVGQKGLLFLRRSDGVAAPRLQPAGLADALRGIRFDDPFPMQFQAMRRSARAALSPAAWSARLSHCPGSGRPSRYFEVAQAGSQRSAAFRLVR